MLRFNGSRVLVPDFTREIYCIFGLPFDAVDLTKAECHIRNAIAERHPCFLTTPNLNFLISSYASEAFRDSVLRSDLSVADGMPIVWLAKLLGIPIRSRVAGSALFERLAQSSIDPIRVYFFGGKEGVAESACKRLNATMPGMRCVGFKSPGFGSIAEMSDEATIAEINASNADFVVVSLGAAKGQAWIEANRHRLSAPVVSHLGAVVNFVAGTVSRSPKMLQTLGGEWLWRIKEEPSLWRRYLHDGWSLFGLAISSIVPLVLARWREALSRRVSAAELHISLDGNNIFVVLSGDWTVRCLGPLREALSRIVLLQKNIVLDIASVDRIDSAFVGLIMLLYGYQKKIGRGMVLKSPGKSVSNYFRYCRAGFLLGASNVPEREKAAGIPAAVIEDKFP